MLIDYMRKCKGYHKKIWEDNEAKEDNEARSEVEKQESVMVAHMCERDLSPISKH